MKKEQNLVEPKMTGNKTDCEWEKYQKELELAIENH
jgi:hypothetical protein